MNRTGLTKLILLLFFLVLGGLTAGARTANAQILMRDADGLNVTDGEPTDPEEALAILGSGSFDTEIDTNTDTGASVEETDGDSWFEALLNLLRELGFVAEPGEESGS